MLSILGSTWGALARCRASLYESGWLRRHTLERPVISVGALSVGGAGKTPTTALLAGLLSEAGCRPAILSRGYKRSGAAPLLVSRGDGRGPIVAVTEAGDEPFWLASALPAVPVAVASHREEAAQVVLSAMTAADVFLLDDGFQHLRVARDVNLLVVNPERPFWDDAPMPVGRLRESPAAATRADAFLIVGADAESTARLHERYPKPQDSSSPARHRAAGRSTNEFRKRCRPAASAPPRPASTGPLSPLPASRGPSASSMISKQTASCSRVGTPSPTTTSSVPETSPKSSAWLASPVPPPWSLPKKTPSAYPGRQ